MIDVPEGKSISTLPTIQVLKVEIVEESIQEVIQKEAESEVIDTKEEQRPGNDFVKNMEVLEVCLHYHKINYIMIYTTFHFTLAHLNFMSV